MKFSRDNLFSFLNLHLLLAAILVIANLVLITRLVLAWNTLRTDRPEQIAALQTNLKTLELQTQPLRGLPAKVDASSEQAQKFYDRRTPANYSSITAELSTLAQKSNVRLARVAYTPVPVFSNLEEVRMDATLAGEYAPIMRCINGLERDRLFFIITGLTFTGQQGGIVNVRLRLTTYIHAQDAGSMTPPPNSGSDSGAGDEPGSPSASMRLPVPGISASGSAAGGQ